MEQQRELQQVDDTHGQQPQQEQQEESLEDYIQILSQHQKNCENEGKYVEAEMANNRIKELKTQLKDREQNELAIRHQNDLYELEGTHVSEFNKFNEDWDIRMNEFQVHSAQLIQALMEKHESQLKDYREELYSKMEDKYKKSPDLLSMENMHQNLARQKEYKDAHKVQMKAQELEKTERERYNQTRYKSAEALQSKMIKKQEMELESLRKRIIAGENEQKKQRALELERMFQRYQNVKKELEANHKKEKNFLKKGGVGFNPNMSRMSSASQHSISQHSSVNGMKDSPAIKKPSNKAYR